jgi:hypothetical protein
MAVACFAVNCAVRGAIGLRWRARRIAVAFAATGIPTALADVPEQLTT